MAYPSNIKSTGALSQVSDLLEYFVGALNHVPTWDSVNKDLNDSNENNPVRVVISNGAISRFLASRGNDGPAIQALPITRSYLYEIFDSWISKIELEIDPTFFVDNYFATTEEGFSLYNFEYPQADWNNKMVTDWGKMKVIEYALFGNCGSDPGKVTISAGIPYAGGLTDNTLPEFNGKTILASSLDWKKTKLSYLRCGLSQFTDYGTYSNNDFPAVLPITSITVNTSNRQITWTYPYPHTNDPSFYEITYDGGITWESVFSMTVTAPGAGFGANKLGIRYKARNYFNASPAVYSTASLPNLLPVTISGEVYISGPRYYCRLKTTDALAVNFSVTGDFAIDYSGSVTTVQVNLLLPANTLEASSLIGSTSNNTFLEGAMLTNTANPAQGSTVSLTAGGSKTLNLSPNIYIID